MGHILSEVAEGNRFVLHISADNNSLDLYGIVKRHLKENIALITILYNQRLSFENVHVDMEAMGEDSIPIMWRNVKVVAYKEDYIVQAPTDGVKHNRRGCFRVAIGIVAQMRSSGNGAKHVLVKDISLTGFAIADRKKELELSKGTLLSIYFEDAGCVIDLTGKLVRIEEREEMTVYGFETINLCRDLSSYLSLKQRRNRTRLD
ncbi:MAG: PilZ domain-containing protein [Lachnospiraceae bacterium]|nr:PilZ domain-containing protein [Lachnospiraceae bacterium]